MRISGQRESGFYEKSGEAKEIILKVVLLKIKYIMVQNPQ